MKLKAMELLSSASMHNVLKAVKLLSHLAAHPAGLVAEGTGAGPPMVHCNSSRRACDGIGVFFRLGFPLHGLKVLRHGGH